ncbi:N4-gp56 family major capsid protein [Mycobacterium sp. D16R24]|uniref:phage major capsid protein n=1 Tax=Mycobacterium sp. D16R24 TaxID=1855656 RepID=UPI000992431B|nr:N4-gp56 family major capsid protein [Mycobacterium sp. D16R24]
MAVDTFIPELWTAQLMIALQTQYVFAQGGVINRDYEGEISECGDTVHIGSLAAPTVATYTKNVTAIDPQTLATTDQTLLVDQSKYFAFEVDDIDARQVRNDGELMSKAAYLAAQELVKVTDAFLSGLMTTQAGTVLAAQDVATADAAYLLVRRLRLALDKANVPGVGRFLLVSPEFYALILGDPRFTDASKYGTNAPIMNGEVGRIVGFSVLVANTIPAGTAGTAPEVSNFVVAGHSMATTYANQINKVEPFRPQNSFSDALKGLHLYGAKVVRPEALAVCDVDVTVT